MSSGLEQQRFEISLRTILATIGILGSIWILFQLRSLLAAIFIALILSLTLDPAIAKLQSWRIPRPLGTVLVFLFGLALFGGAVIYGLTPIVSQIGMFLLGLPRLVEPILERLGPPSPLAEQLESQLLAQLNAFSSSLVDSMLGITTTLVSNLTFVLNVLILTMYLLLDWANVKGQFIALFSRPARKRVGAVLDQMEQQLGGWVRGVLILMAVVGVLTFLGLWALGVEYSLPLALLAAVLEILPAIGPMVAAVPALIVGFNASPWVGLGVLALFVVVQQLENNFIVPQVMSKAIGFSPLATLIILFAGATLFGVGGLFLALPVTLTLSIIVREIFADS